MVPRLGYTDPRRGAIGIPVEKEGPACGERDQVAALPLRLGAVLPKRRESAAGEVVAFAEAQGVKTQMYKANVGDEDECHQMIERAIADFGQVDALINNAGLGPPIDQPTIADATNQQWNKLLRVNLGQQ